MNNSNQHNASTATGQADKSVLNNSGPAPVGSGPFSQIPAKKVTTPPPLAAKGDDVIMSKQQHQSIPSVDAIKGQWKQHVGNAKIAWGKLTEDELLKSEGHEQKLAGLVQERYAVTRDEADKQVKSFFAKHKS
ncbi:MAG: CsbD family protein [Nevskia sp.]|nr:CsbD family protein [Nevskia sp.]